MLTSEQDLPLRKPEPRAWVKSPIAVLKEVVKDLTENVSFMEAVFTFQVLATAFNEVVNRRGFTPYWYVIMGMTLGYLYVITLNPQKEEES